MSALALMGVMCFGARQSPSFSRTCKSIAARFATSSTGPTLWLSVIPFFFCL